MNPKNHDKVKSNKASLPDSFRRIDEIVEAQRLLFLQKLFHEVKEELFTNQHGEIVINFDGTRPQESGDLPALANTRDRDMKFEMVRNSFRRYGWENFKPLTDFEWGMLNGKLSAIRWMLGDEWDMLDT